MLIKNPAFVKAGLGPYEKLRRRPFAHAVTHLSSIGPAGLNYRVRDGIGCQIQ